MTKTKSTKRALLLSALSLLMCVSMLIGSTFAWFTDSASSDTNKIVAGNLDVELYHADKAQPTDELVGGSTKLFDDVTLWEPGAIVWEKLTVKNNGTLALKYNLSVNVTDISSVDGKSLADVLKVAVLYEQPTRENVANAAIQNLETFNLKSNKALEAGNSDVLYVAIYWKPSADDNNYNVKDEALNATLGVTLMATQYTSESDSFDDQYDKDATYPGEVKTVNSVEEFIAAVKAGESIKLGTAIEVASGTNLTYNADAKIDLAGHNLTFTGSASLKITSGELNLVDSEGTANINLNKGTIKADGANAVINIENVEITMGTNITNDRIQVLNGATVNMNGGKLVSAGRPCVYLDGGTFNMNGGEIVVPANKSGITCGTSGTNAINLNGGKITVASGAIGINTMNLGSIYISNGFVFELADATAYSLLIVDSQAPTITGTEPANVKHS